MLLSDASWTVLYGVQMLDLCTLAPGGLGSLYPT